jgi:hypothetical protein
MHDQLDYHRMKEDGSLAAALRAMPSAAPPRHAWQQLASRIARRRRIRTALRFAVPAAMAAGIALAFVWPRAAVRLGMPTARPVAATAPSSPQAPGDAGLAALRAHSQQLQQWVGKLDHDGAPLNGDALATAVTLQDRIGLVDLQLSATRDPAAAAGLWQQRNALLERLGMLHLQLYVAVRGSGGTPGGTTLIL